MWRWTSHRKLDMSLAATKLTTPKVMTYSSVVSRESMQIALFLAALNDLGVCLTDIGNAYLMAPTTECCYVLVGDEFGPELKGCILKIVWALYGLKSAGASFHAHLASILQHVMGFMPCEADPDVWMHLAKKPDGTPINKFCAMLMMS